MSHERFPLQVVQHVVRGEWISGRDGHWTTKHLTLAQIVDTRWVVQLTDHDPRRWQTRLLDDGDRARWVAAQMMKAPNVLGGAPAWTEVEPGHR